MAPRRTKPPSKTKAVISLPTLIELFILSKQIEGRSPKTLSWYQANLERFSDFVTDGQVPTLQEITLDNARTFVAYLQGKSTRERCLPDCDQPAILAGRDRGDSRLPIGNVQGLLGSHRLTPRNSVPTKGYRRQDVGPQRRLTIT